MPAWRTNPKRRFLRISSTLYPDSLWQEAFDAFSASEQMCIRNELGDDLLKSALNRPILGERETEQWEVSILECLEPATAASLVYSLMLAGMEAEGLALDEEAKYCIWGLLADTDVAVIMAATLPDAGPGSEAVVEEFDARLSACLEGQLNMGAGEPAAGPPPPDESLIWQYNPGELLIVSATVADGVVYAGSYEDRVRPGRGYRRTPVELRDRERPEPASPGGRGSGVRGRPRQPLWVGCGHRKGTVEKRALLLFGERSDRISEPGSRGRSGGQHGRREVR